MTAPFVFRALQKSDYPLIAAWLAEPHVAARWREQADVAHVAAMYDASVEGREPAYVFVIEHDRHLIGWVQWFRWSDYPQDGEQMGVNAGAAGLDLAIGEASQIARGLGPAIIGAFIKTVVGADPTINCVITDIDADNVRSLRAFAKAGFRPAGSVEADDKRRTIVRLDLE